MPQGLLLPMVLHGLHLRNCFRIFFVYKIAMKIQMYLELTIFVILTCKNKGSKSLQGQNFEYPKFNMYTVRGKY